MKTPYPFEVRFPAGDCNMLGWNAKWAPPNERELQDPLYLMQRLGAHWYHTSAQGGFTRSRHLHAMTGKVWAWHCHTAVEQEGDRLYLLLRLCHGVEIGGVDSTSLFKRLLPYFDGTVTAQELIGPGALDRLESKMPDAEAEEALYARHGSRALNHKVTEERGTIVQRLLKLRPVYPIPRITPPFPQAIYPCVNGWNAMWAPPRGAKELDVLALARRLLKLEAGLLTKPLPADTTLLNKHLVEAVWDEEVWRLQSIFECLTGHPFLLRVVLCVDAVAVACFEDGSVSSEDLAAPDHLQRITHIVTQAHARRGTPSSPTVAAVVLAPPTEPGDAEPTVTYYDRFPPSVVAHIEEVIAQERRAKPDDVHEHAAIAAAMEAAAAYPCNRAPDLNRATTRWQPILAHYVPQDQGERATLLHCLQALSPYVAAASPAGCQPALLRYVMDFAQGLQSESSSRCAPPAVCPLVAVGALVHQQPATPPMSPGPVQEEEQVTLTLQHEQTQHTATTQHTSAQPRLQPQAEDKEDEGQPRGCWAWLCRTVRRAMDWLFGRKKKYHIDQFAVHSIRAPLIAGV